MENERAIDRALKAWRDRGSSEAELARRIGVSPQALQKWKATDIPPGRMLEVADAVGVDVYRLSEGSPRHANVSPGPEARGSVPLLMWAKVAGSMGRAEFLIPGDVMEWIPVTFEAHENAYALRVEGDSMAPDFPEGTVIIVEPKREPQPNQYVVAVNPDGEATFKQLVRDSGEWLLRPINPAYPTRRLDYWKVVGIAREVRRMLP